MTTTMMPCELHSPPTTATPGASDDNTISFRQEKNWHETLNVLARFAALDTMQYATMYNNTHSDGQSSLMLQLEALRRDGGFEDTPIPDLVRAIHQFHSNLAMWHHQDAQHSKEMRQLQVALTESQNREHSLMQECKKINNQNAKLRTKLQEKRNLLAGARLWLKESVAERESLQEIATVAQLQVHEHLMTTPGRIRLNSTESNFSDVDALNYIEGDSTEATDGDYTNTGSIEESASQSSLATDEGVATLHFKADESLPRIAATSSPYTLEFPSGAKTGMRVKSVPVSEWTPLAKPALSSFHLDGSSNDAVSDEHDEMVESPADGLVFVVCGHHRFDSDDESNSRSAHHVALPPVGARILAVRDQKITTAWCIADVLGAMSNTEDEKPTFKVTFRNGRIIKCKEQKTLASDTSDEESSQGDNQKNEPTVGQARNGRSFNLFGMNNGRKPKENQESAECDSTPAHPKGNPLTFWRNNEDKTVDTYKQQDHPDDLSFEESPGESLKDQAKLPSRDDTTKTGHGTNPLMFWKKGDSEARLGKNIAESFGLRQRKNTADSAAITEATIISKEDSSVTSCSEHKTEECHPVTVSEETTGNRSTQMNHLMFWRKTDETQYSGEVADATEEAQQELKTSAQENHAVSRQHAPNEGSSESPSFKLSFWNQSTREIAPALTEKKILTSSKDKAVSGPDVQDGSVEKCTVESMRSTGDGPASRRDPASEVPNTEEPHNADELRKDQGLLVAGSKDGTEMIDNLGQTVKDGALPTERVEETPADPDCKVVDSGSSACADEQNQERTEERSNSPDGPMKQMSRFFARPFTG